MIQETQFNLQFVWEVTRKHFWYIAGAVFLGIAGAFIFTMPYFYPPQYKSSTIIFPASPDRFDGTRVFTKGESFYLFGGSDDLERLLEIARSEEVALHVIDSLNLWKAYDVPKDGPSPRFYVLETYIGNVTVTKAEGNGLEITAYDEDPERAAAIVNTVVYFTEKSMRNMLKQSKAFIGAMYLDRRKQLETALVRAQDSIARLRATYNVLSDQTQTEMIVEQVMKAEGDLAAERARLPELRKHYPETDTIVINTQVRIKGYEQRLRALTSRSSGSSINLEKYREGLDKIDVLENRIYLETTQLNDMQDRYEQIQAYESHDFSSISRIQQATASDRKAKPVRWVIVLTSLLLTGFGAIATALFIEGIRLRKANA